MENDSFDDDESEMQRLRQSKKYHGIDRQQQQQPAKPAQPQHKEEAKKPALTESDPLILNDEDLAKFNLPMSFGSKKVKTSTTELVDKTKRVGPTAPLPGPRRVVGPTRGTPEPAQPAAEASKPEESKQEKDEDDEFVGPPRPAQVEEEQEYGEENTNFYNIPFSHEIVLAEHTKQITALNADPSGSRVVTGGYDYQVKFWDFAGMDSSLRSFRNIEPAEGNQIMSLQWSKSGDKFLVATGNCQAQIFDRDGSLIDECCRGDMYLTDMSNTNGHISSLGNAMWHPTERDLFLTSSMDGTVRIWDTNRMKLKQKTVIKARADTGRRVGVSYAIWSPDAKWIAAAAQDGSIQLWPAQGPYTRPSTTIKAAHKSDITCLAFSTDGYTLVSRSIDDSMKVWDVRNPRTPLAEFTDLPNFGETKCAFSPDDKLIMTGTSVNKGEGTGLLVFYDKVLLRRVMQIGVAKGASVIAMEWHPKINQIFVGCSDNKIHVFYDPKLSTKGALLSVTREPRVKDPNDYEPPRPIHLPNALPAFDETPWKKRKQERERILPNKSMKPEVAPAEAGPGHHGKLGTSMNSILIQNYMKPHFDAKLKEDPREAILKYAQEASENPMIFAAYQKTQPNPVFDYSEEPVPGRVKPKEKKPGYSQ